MKSKITIDVDHDNQPIIKIEKVYSEDVRDKLIHKFVSDSRQAKTTNFQLDSAGKRKDDEEYTNYILRPTKLITGFPLTDNADLMWSIVSTITISFNVFIFYNSPSEHIQLEKQGVEFVFSRGNKRYVTTPEEILLGIKTSHAVLYDSPPSINQAETVSKIILFLKLKFAELLKQN